MSTEAEIVNRLNAIMDDDDGGVEQEVETREPVQNETLTDQGDDRQIEDEAISTESPGDQDPQDDANDEEEQEIASLSDLANYLNVEVSDLYHVKIPVTAGDGTKREVTIGEWKDSYQEHGTLLAERRRLEQEVEQTKLEVTEKMKSLDAAYIQADQLVSFAERQILGKVDDAEMTQLRVTNPAEYAIKKQEYMDGLAELRNLRQQAVVHYQQQMAEGQQKMEAQRNEYLQNQASLLPTLIPEWSDSSRMETEKSELSNYLTSYGIPEEEVRAIDSALVVSLARKAMLWDKQQKVKPDAKKRKLTVGGKVLKPGKPKSKSDRESSSRQQARLKIRNAPSGRQSEKAAQAYIEEFLLGDM